MLTYEIFDLLEERNYLVKKASEIAKLVDARISTQIKFVKFNACENSYNMKLFDFNPKTNSKTKEDIWLTFRIYTIDQFNRESTLEEYLEECRDRNAIPDNGILLSKGFDINSLQIIRDMEMTKLASNIPVINNQVIGKKYKMSVNYKKVNRIINHAKPLNNIVEEYKALILVPSSFQNGQRKYM